MTASGTLPNCDAALAEFSAQRAARFALKGGSQGLPFIDSWHLWHLLARRRAARRNALRGLCRARAFAARPAARRSDQKRNNRPRLSPALEYPPSGQRRSLFPRQSRPGSRKTRPRASMRRTTMRAQSYTPARLDSADCHGRGRGARIAENLFNAANASSRRHNASVMRSFSKASRASCAAALSLAVMCSRNIAYSPASTLVIALARSSRFGAAPLLRGLGPFPRCSVITGVLTTESL
jgi:hypothetical protein